MAKSARERDYKRIASIFILFFMPFTLEVQIRDVVVLLIFSPIPNVFLTLMYGKKLVCMKALLTYRANNTNGLECNRAYNRTQLCLAHSTFVL